MTLAQLLSAVGSLNVPGLYVAVPVTQEGSVPAAGGELTGKPHDVSVTPGSAITVVAEQFLVLPEPLTLTVPKQNPALTLPVTLRLELSARTPALVDTDPTI